MQKAGWIKGMILGGIGVLLVGCATTHDVQTLDTEARRLHSQLNTVQKETQSIKKDLSTFQKEVERDVSALRIDLNNLNNEMKKLQADLFLRLETLQSEIRILSTGVEEYKEFLKKPSKEIDRVREDVALRTRILEEKGKTFEEKIKIQDNRTKTLDERIKGLEDRFKGFEDRSKGLEDRFKVVEDRLKGLDGKIEGLVSKQMETEKSAPAKEAPSELKGLSTGVGDLYKDAFDTFQRGDLEGARRKFETFLKQYPNTELSDNAQFWIGETYYLKKDFEKAILEYEKAIAKYPEGDKIPAALFKQSLSFLEIGDKTNARNLLKRVIERYPYSDQADMAKKKLEGLK